MVEEMLLGYILLQCGDKNDWDGREEVAVISSINLIGTLPLILFSGTCVHLIHSEEHCKVHPNT